MASIRKAKKLGIYKAPKYTKDRAKLMADTSISQDDKIAFTKTISEINETNILNKLLEYCPHKRITAKEALKHPYFKNIVLDDDNNLSENDDCNSNVFNIKTIKDN